VGNLNYAWHTELAKFQRYYWITGIIVDRPLRYSLETLLITTEGLQHIVESNLYLNTSRRHRLTTNKRIIHRKLTAKSQQNHNEHPKPSNKFTEDISN
jgi:hypothetical protein